MTVRHAAQRQTLSLRQAQPLHGDRHLRIRCRCSPGAQKGSRRAERTTGRTGEILQGVAFCLGLKGPAYVVDTACSSALAGDQMAFRGSRLEYFWVGRREMDRPAFVSAWAHKHSRVSRRSCQHANRELTHVNSSPDLYAALEAWPL